MDLFVHYSDTGLDLYLQFDDSADTRIPFVEGATGKLRRYVVTLQDVIDSGLSAGTWHPTIRVGDYDDPQDDDSIEASSTFIWDGEQETVPVIAIGESGGGVLTAHIGTVSLNSQDFLEIVQGEQKIVTFIVEAHGRFVSSSAQNITVKFADVAGEVITKTEADDSIQRVCEELDVQVLRCTLSETDTQSLSEGLCVIELSFDDQKARLTHSLKILEAIIAGVS